MLPTSHLSASELVSHNASFLPSHLSSSRLILLPPVLFPHSRLFPSCYILSLSPLSSFLFLASYLFPFPSVVLSHRPASFLPVFFCPVLPTFFLSLLFFCSILPYRLLLSCASYLLPFPTVLLLSYHPASFLLPVLCFLPTTEVQR